RPSFGLIPARNGHAAGTINHCHTFFSPTDVGSKTTLVSPAHHQFLLQTEIQHCLVNAGDVGCGVFECFENNSCEIRGLHEICMTFLHNAGKFDAQGKSFIKDALKCKAHALRHKFSCISRKCPAIKEMVFQLQRECYLKHDLCSAAKENVQVIVEMIHFKDLIFLPHLCALILAQKLQIPAVKWQIFWVFLQNHCFGNFNLAFYLPHYPKELCSDSLRAENHHPPH
uniref:Stanniocalcin-2 n=1 Tax=Cyanoderma ruficeps TaxID=181631 RepID=A0A8C3RG60_9PASS